MRSFFWTGGHCFGPIAGSGGIQGNIAKNMQSAWTLHMDFADLDLGRWYYVGTKLTFRPFIGLRGAWIDQSQNTNYQNPGASTTLSASNYAKTDSWAVGSRGGFNTNWDLNYGLRFIGNGSADILYTRYKWIGKTTVTGPLTGSR